MKFSFNKASLIDFILALRLASIILQMLLILVVYLFLHYELPWMALMCIIAIEACFNLFCYWHPKLKGNSSSLHIVLQLIADLCFLGTLLYLSGGATNAFVSLLLIPIAIAAVTLSTQLLALVAILAVATYSLLLAVMPLHSMHGNIEGHFIGMWVNFLFSTAIVSVVISQMAKSINTQKLMMAEYREEQLKQEQIIALGVASAQVTHDLATPISSINLLVDELQEEKALSENQKGSLALLKSQVERCCANLEHFRVMTLDIKNNHKKAFPLSDIIKLLKSYCHLHYPQAPIHFEVLSDIPLKGAILSDNALIPAIINVIDNAIKVSHTVEAEVVVSFYTTLDSFYISIKDTGMGFDPQTFVHLGQQVTESKEGLGLALLLSNTNIERLQGSLTLDNHDKGGAVVSIRFPLYHSKTQEH